MPATLIKNARVVNEGTITETDLRIVDQRIETIEKDIMARPAGLPLVQHALLSLFDQVRRGRMSMEQVVEKTAHNPAIRYGIEQRGFIREGYYADLVLVDTESPTLVTNDNSLYHCGWSPFAGHAFSAQIKTTWVNGDVVYANHEVIEPKENGMRLSFKR